MSHSRIFGFIPGSDSNTEHTDDCVTDLLLKSGLSIDRKSCGDDHLFIEASQNPTSKNFKEQ